MIVFGMLLGCSRVRLVMAGRESPRELLGQQGSVMHRRNLYVDGYDGIQLIRLIRPSE